jgi:hypothetical protein
MSLFYVESVKKDNPEVKEEQANESISEGSTTETTVV